MDPYVDNVQDRTPPEWLQIILSHYEEPHSNFTDPSFSYINYLSYLLGYI